MNVEFTNRAVRDLREIAARSRAQFGERIATALEARLQEVITQIAVAPESAPRVDRRPGMRVVSLVRYPFKIFYRITGDTVRIVHVRHSARRPWTEAGN
jgi:plasmid stabilization system protein ParE